MGTKQLLWKIRRIFSLSRPFFTARINFEVAITVCWGQASTKLTSQALSFRQVSILPKEMALVDVPKSWNIRANRA
jgi:hypothetical protein